MRRVNSVFQFTLKGSFDFDKFSDGYYSKKFSGVIIKRDKSRVLLFKSGKVTVTGLRTRKEAKALLSIIFGGLKLINGKTLNMTFSSKLKFHLDFSRLLRSGYVTHEPELFPGVYWRNNQSDSRAVIILFASGKYILTGVKSGKSLKNFHESFKTFISQFKKNKV
ncbi:uncharacterized protein LOC141857416 [Brevipalpus obovatus]|uniref:uncharacterized protein LOC141857416 n=1 Tax=Brevipalpus obovatus TaxID=246614 RepID=UPI003D9F720E